MWTMKGLVIDAVPSARHPRESNRQETGKQGWKGKEREVFLEEDF